MGLLQAMILAMGLFLGTANNTQGSDNKNNASANGKSNANANSGLIAPAPVNPPCDTVSCGVGGGE